MKISTTAKVQVNATNTVLNIPKMFKEAMDIKDKDVLKLVLNVDGSITISKFNTQLDKEVK